MSDIKAKMHQIRCDWGSAANPAGELTALPQMADCPSPRTPSGPSPALGPSGLAASVRAWNFFTNISP